VNAGLYMGIFLSDGNQFGTRNPSISSRTANTQGTSTQTLLQVHFSLYYTLHYRTANKCILTAKNRYRKFETNIPRKGIAWPHSQFTHPCVCERFIYSHHRSAFSAAGKYVIVDRSWECINRSQTHERENWD
jgi:hypothetical protein